jgi:septum formation protein
MGERLILASTSPRRKDLISKITDDFVTREPLCDEIDGGAPQYVAETNATRKGRSVAGGFVAACDTLVALDGKIFGKPHTKEAAVAMLKELNGKTHEVFSGVYVRFHGEETVFTEKSAVTFKILTDAQITDYVEKFLPLDKAGSYGIQDNVIVDNYTGSLDNIIGLPTEKLREILRKYIYVKEESNG